MPTRDHHGETGRRQRGEEELSELHLLYAVTRDRRLRDELAAAYDDLALALVRGFATRRESAEDLAQVARIALLGAIDRFDPARARPFIAYARATVVGELKRHLRDRTWALRVPRSLQEQWLAIVGTVDELTQELGRSPLVAEVARRARLTEEEVLEAMELGRVSQPAPLHVPLKGDARPVDPGVPEEGFARLEEHDLLGELLGRLGERERLVVKLRFVDELTQAEIAEQIGVSQMWVSRTLKRTLARLRQRAMVPGRC